jgi:hypothetical protein
MSLINSYWDLLDTDIQDFIIKIRDDTVEKDNFKKGEYVFKGFINLSITDFTTKTIKIFWNMNHIYRQKYSNQLVHSFTEKKRYKIRYDIHNVPYILFEFSHSFKYRLYFKQLKKSEEMPFSNVWRYLMHNQIF